MRDESVDMIFSDPPYFLSNGGIPCVGGCMVKVDKGGWDKINPPPNLAVHVATTISGSALGQGILGRQTAWKVRRYETNQHGSSGSKPAEVARYYISRQPVLDAASVGFIWVTDGLGWTKMRNPLREAFTEIHHLVIVKLASEGLLEWAVQHTLFPKYK